MNKTISIILCTYNEVNYIEEAINLITKTLKNTEIIIVDDNSIDGTLNKLDKLKSNFHFKLIIRKKERGFASAVYRGLNEATGDYVGFIDVNSYDQIIHFKDMISKLDNRYDISVLSRYVPGGGDERVFLRSFSSKAINSVCKFLLRIPFNDFTSGIFLMRKNLLNYVRVIPTGHGEFFIEFIYSVYKKNFKIIEIPYVQKKDNNLGKSKSNPNIFHFFYLGFMYFLRIILTIFRN